MIVLKIYLPFASLYSFVRLYIVIRINLANMAEVALIWHRFHRELREFVIRKTKSPADADDILQDVFVKIIHNSEKVSKAHDLRQYLYAIVRNAIYDHFRNQPGKELDSYMPDELTDHE